MIHTCIVFRMNRLFTCKVKVNWPTLHLCQHNYHLLHTSKLKLNTSKLEFYFGMPHFPTLVPEALCQYYLLLFSNGVYDQTHKDQVYKIFYGHLVMLAFLLWAMIDCQIHLLLTFLNQQEHMHNVSMLYCLCFIYRIHSNFWWTIFTKISKSVGHFLKWNFEIHFYSLVCTGYSI